VLLSVVPTRLISCFPVTPNRANDAANLNLAQAQARGEAADCSASLQDQDHRGSLLSFLGCSLDPPTFASAIKCHQKSTSNSAGSSVGSLAPPLGHPTAGRCVRVVPVLPLLLCLYSPCASSAFDWGSIKAQLPLRASSRGVLPGAGALEYGNRRLRAVCHFEAADSKLESIL
jgi:hypothetical protein